MVKLVSSQPLSDVLWFDLISGAYTRTANLRTLPFKPGCPEVIQHSWFIFEKPIAPQSRSSLFTDIHTLSTQLEEEMQPQEVKRIHATALSPELRCAFSRAGVNAAHRAQSLSHLTINGLTYTTSSKHAGNACALITFPGCQQVLPCQIVYIVQFQSGNDTATYLGVRRHKPAQIRLDPYLRYAALRAKIWDSRLGDLEVVKAPHVKSHFACFPIQMEGQDQSLLCLFHV